MTLAKLLDGYLDIDQGVEVSAECLRDVQFSAWTDQPARIAPFDLVGNVSSGGQTWYRG